MTPATKQGEETRRRILDVAAEAFAREGYGGTSLNDLIRAAGLTKGAFYFHFDSKEALALEVYRQKQASWLGAVAGELYGEGPAIDRFAAAARSVFALVEADPAARCVGKIAEDLAADPRLAPEVRRVLDGWIQPCAELLRRAVEEGDARPDLDVEGAAEAAVGALIGLERLSELRGDRGLGRRVDVFLRLFLDGVTAEGSTRGGAARPPAPPERGMW